MSFGSQTVGLVTVTEAGPPGYLGVKAKQRTVTLRHNVHFRPAGTSETPDAQTDVATEVWKLTDASDLVSLAMKSTGELIYDGTPTPQDVKANRFQIEGPIQPKHDFGGEHHVTIICKRQAG